ncbi:unnamed protein product [Paramecium pentaurelia]|uniref:Uncharacterized protein n=1 Tax=Paramecium pentaurelia TaxID=43138 RepID=A0A8S1YIP1_9CILI|nr:unnamed protein product [Paramecium pentaurelia]
MILLILLCLTPQQAMAQQCASTDPTICNAESNCGWWPPGNFCLKCSNQYTEGQCMDTCGWYNSVCTYCPSVPTASCIQSGCGLSTSSQCIHCGGISSSTCANYNGCYLNSEKCLSQRYSSSSNCLTPYQWVDSRCQIYACTSSKKSSCLCGTSNLVICSSTQVCVDISASTGVCQEKCNLNLNSNSCLCGGDSVECNSTTYCVDIAATSGVLK